VSEKSFSQLPMYRGGCPVMGQALSWSNTTALRERLLAEICAVAQHRELREQIDGKMDFSLQQTCKEMIHVRRQLYRQLER